MLQLRQEESSVETILRGDYPDTISLESLRPGIPVDWNEQRQRYGLVQ